MKTRLAMFAAAFVALSPMQASAGDWIYPRRIDDACGQAERCAKLWSENSVQPPGPYHPTRLMATLAHFNERNTDAIVFKLEHYTMIGRIDEINVRFDDGPIMTLRGRLENFSLAIPDSDGSLVQRIRAARRMNVEMSMFQGGARQFHFDVAGLRW